MRKILNIFFNKGSLPILILAGVVIFVALILDIARLALFSEPSFTKNKPSPFKVKVSSYKSDNLFDNIHTKYPSYKEFVINLVQKKVPFSSHNYVLGNPKSKVRIVLFNDNDCRICREELHRITRVLKPILGKILVIYKHMPADKNKESMSAMFGQIAIRKGVYNEFLAELNNFDKKDKSTEDYLILLETIGVSLAEQREIMIYDMPEILREVQEDIALATNAGAYNARHQPVIYLNGYQLGRRYLPEHKMLYYINRLLKGEDIVPKIELKTDTTKESNLKKKEASIKVK